ncbi:MAG TPA: redoxin domain-containing protein [Chitinophagaceae bacterium]|nr:redoxin domain-containing protein [Chitinophagaceae bacterium]
MLLFVAASGFSQSDTLTPPYKRFPHIPPFKLLLGDSTTVFTKDSLQKTKPVLLMLFSPECSHCQHTAEELVQHKAELQGVQIIMATMHTITQMNEFSKTYGLAALSNVVLGKDIYFILPPFYSIHNLPYMAFYKANGDLIRTVEGSLPIERVLDVFKKEMK